MVITFFTFMQNSSFRTQNINNTPISTLEKIIIDRWGSPPWPRRSHAVVLGIVSRLHMHTTDKCSGDGDRAGAVLMVAMVEPISISACKY